MGTNINSGAIYIAIYTCTNYTYLHELGPKYVVPHMNRNVYIMTNKCDMSYMTNDIFDR